MVLISEPPQTAKLPGCARRFWWEADFRFDGKRSLGYSNQNQ